MARESKSRRAVVVDLPPEDEATTEVETEEERAADDTLETVREDSPRQPLAVLWRVDEDTGEERWLWRGSAALVNEEWLAKRYGGGKYRAQFRKPSGAKMVFAGQKTYIVDPGVDVDRGNNVVFNADGAPAGGGGSDPMGKAQAAAMLGFVTQMQQGMQLQMEQARTHSQMTMQLVQGMAESMRRVNEPAGPSPLLALLVPVLPALIEKMLGRNEQALDMIRQLGEIMKPASSGTGSFKETLESMKMMQELLGNGHGDGDDNMMGIVREGLSTVRTLAAAGGAAPAAPVAPALPPHAARPTLMPGPAVREVDAVIGSIPAAEQPPLVPAAAPRVVPLWMRRIKDGLRQLLNMRVFLTPETAVDHYTANTTDAETDDLERDIAAGTVNGETFVERTMLTLTDGQMFAEAEAEWLWNAVHVLSQTTFSDTEGGPDADSQTAERE